MYITQYGMHQREREKGRICEKMVTMSKYKKKAKGYMRGSLGYYIYI